MAARWVNCVLHGRIEETMSDVPGVIQYGSVCGGVGPVTNGPFVRTLDYDALAAEAAGLREQVGQLQSELYAGDNGTLSYRQLRDRLRAAEITVTQQKERIAELERDLAGARATEHDLRHNT
jgi:hypothetical protein